MTDPAPLVSVLVAAYNARRYLAAAIRSALAQTHPALEIIIVNDGSSDGTGDLADALASEDPRIRVLHQRNRGNAVALNAAAAAARGDLLAVLDADDVWFPDKLARQVAALDAAGPACALVYCWVIYMDAEGRLTGGYIAHDVAGHARLSLLCFNPAGCGSAVLMRRSAFTAVGGFNTARRGVVDIDLYLRIAERHTVTVVPKALVAYRQVPDSLSRRPETMQASFEAMLEDAVARHPATPGPVLAWARGAFYAVLAPRALRARAPGLALLYGIRALLNDPTQIVRFWRRARRTTAPWGSDPRTIADALADERGAFAPSRPSSDWPLSLSPLGPLAAQRRALLAEWQAQDPAPAPASSPVGAAG